MVSPSGWVDDCRCTEYGGLPLKPSAVPASAADLPSLGLLRAGEGARSMPEDIEDSLLLKKPSGQAPLRWSTGWTRLRQLRCRWAATTGSRELRPVRELDLRRVRPVAARRPELPASVSRRHAANGSGRRGLTRLLKTAVRYLPVGRWTGGAVLCVLDFAIRRAAVDRFSLRTASTSANLQRTRLKSCARIIC